MVVISEGVKEPFRMPSLMNGQRNNVEQPAAAAAAKPNRTGGNSGRRQRVWPFDAQILLKCN